MATAAAEIAERFSRALDAVEREDIDAAMVEAEAIIGPGFSFQSVFGLGVEGRAYEGVPGMREYFVDLTDAFGVEYADREFREAEDKVVFLGTLKLQGRGSDVEVVQPISIVMDHDADGRILGATTHLSQDEGLARAGLSS